MWFRFDELIVVIEPLKLQTLSHSLGASGQRDKIQTIPLAECHVMEDFFILVQAVTLQPSVLRDTGFHFIRILWQGNSFNFYVTFGALGKSATLLSFPC